MENPIKMDDLGGFPIIFGSPPMKVCSIDVFSGSQLGGF